jgi:ADP-heptose:LPS heptosyltransferase
MLRYAFFTLLKKKYDLGIQSRWFTDIHDASFLMYFSGAKIRVGYSHSSPFYLKNKSEAKRNYDKLFTHVISDFSFKHVVERELKIIEFLEGVVEDDNLELWLDKDDENFAQVIIENNNINKDVWLIGMGIGTWESKRRWPIERFLELIEWLLKETNSKIILLGDENEIELGKCVERRFPSKIINLIGKTTLRQAPVILKYCKLYIGNDTGIMHMAAAMKTPTVGIFSCSKRGSPYSRNSPYLFAPWKTEFRIVNPDKQISPCRDECINVSAPHCILQVTVEDVKQAIKELLPKD